MIFISILILSFIGQLFLPWWIILPIAFIVSGLSNAKKYQAFLSAFLAIYILWFIVALFMSVPNEHVLAGRVGQILGFEPHALNWLWVLLIGNIPAALVAGFAALSGQLGRALYKKKF